MALYTLHSKEKQQFFSLYWFADWVAHKFDFYNLQVAEGEARASLLQREMERLSQALFKAQENESLLREKTSSLKKSIQEAAASHSSTQSRLAALQKMLSEAEQDKRLLQVSKTEGKEGCEQCWWSVKWWLLYTNKDQMDEARASVGEGRRNMAALTERVQSLQSELNQSELRREELEAELNSTQEVR